MPNTELLKTIHTRLAEIMCDLGWPMPCVQFVGGQNQLGCIAWRRGEQDSTVILSTYERFDPNRVGVGDDNSYGVLRYAVSVRGIKESRWLLTDGGQIYVTGDDPEPRHLADALDLFRSVIGL